MDCFLTYCRAFLEMQNDGLRSGGKRQEGGEQECEGRNTGGRWNEALKSWQMLHQGPGISDLLSCRSAKTSPTRHAYGGRYDLRCTAG